MVVAELDQPLRWLKPDESMTFWTQELRAHVCAGQRFYLEDYVGLIATSPPSGNSHMPSVQWCSNAAAKWGIFRFRRPREAERGGHWKGSVCSAGRSNYE